jgi:hypothetical protein
MSVRAKFYVDTIAKHRDYNGKPMSSIKMLPVGPKFEGNTMVECENSAFWSASPAGELNLNVVNEDAVKQFEVGKEY